MNVRSCISAVLSTLFLAATQAAPGPESDSARHVGPTSGGQYIVATGQSLQPAGDSVTFGGRPVDLALSPDSRVVYLKDNRGLVAVDARSWKVAQSLPFTTGGGSMHGIAVSADGRHVYVTNAQNLLAIADVATDGKLSWGSPITLPGPKGDGDADPCGIALSADGKRAYVCLSRNNTLAVVDLAAGKLLSQIPVGIAPYDVVLSPDGIAYVSNWGGRHPKANEPQAPSAGTQTLVDARGVGASGTVSRVILKEGREFSQDPAGLHPSTMAISKDGRRIYVANANSDTVTTLLWDGFAIGTASVHPIKSLAFGSAPTGLALSADEKTLFVTLGGNNAVAVLDLTKNAGIRGFIPTGWYPGAIATDGKNLYIANVKGIGSRERGNAKGYNSHQFSGTAQRVTIPRSADLARYTAQVRKGLTAAQTATGPHRKAAKAAVPVPARPGDPSVIKHVVYVIKENRTYDQLFGDLSQGDGDKSLCIYGRDVTPNHHALAEQFTLLDNYYCNGVLSADGHSWATEGNVTDHLEKSFGGFTRSYTFGDDPLTYSSSGFIWDNALQHGKTFYNFGEMDYAGKKPDVGYADILQRFQNHTQQVEFTHSIGIARLKRYSHPTYPGWALDIPDVVRADIFLSALKDFEQKGSFPNLTIIYLPDDHTSGTSPGDATPRSYLADNDLALGRIVDGISRSRFWNDTAIFVNEDDPQDGFDHVDGHRSLCLVISPYTKRRSVIHQFYNQTSVLHTMEQMLGLPPMNQMDAMSPLMRECFISKPDFTPYTCLPNTTPLGEINPKVSQLRGQARRWAKVSAKMDWSHPDAISDEALNHVLWYAAKAGGSPYPESLKSGQARRLRARGLKLSVEHDD